MRKAQAQGCVNWERAGKNRELTPTPFWTRRADDLGRYEWTS